MFPLLLGGIIILLPYLFTRMPSHIQRWMIHNPFSISSNPSTNYQDAALQAEPLYFHIDPGKIPDVDISLDGQVLPPLLFPIVSGPHCLAEPDIAPQPVCYAVVDDPEFFDMTLYRSDDPFVQSWDQLRASLAYLAGTRMAVTLGVCFVLALFVPFVPDMLYHLSNIAYTIASASFIVGYTAACHAVGLASMLLYLLDAVGWMLSHVSGGGSKTVQDEEALRLDVRSPIAVSDSTDVSEPLSTPEVTQLISLSAQDEVPIAVDPETSRDSIALAPSALTSNASGDNPDTSTSSLEVEPASPQSIPEDPSTEAASQPSSPISTLPIAEAEVLQPEAAPLSPATVGGLSLQALYTCSKQYQAQITASLPTPDSEVEVDLAAGSVSSADVDTRRVRFISDSITLISSQSLSGQENLADAWSLAHADSAVLDRSLALKEAEVERLERGALAPVSPLGFSLRTSNLKEVTPSPSPPSFAKYELPVVRLARMRTQSESPASLIGPKTPVDSPYGSGARIQSNSLVDTPGPSIADSTSNWRTRRSRGATFSIMKQDDASSPLYPRSALRKAEVAAPSSPATPSTVHTVSFAPTSTPIRMPLGPTGSPFKKRRGTSIAVKADTTEAPDWVKVAPGHKRARTRTRTSSRNEKENMPSLWNVVNRAPRPRLPSSGPSFLM